MLSELYQEIIVDHTRAPRNFGELVEPSHHAEGYNPLCGDAIKLFLKIDAENKIQAIKFTGHGCSISTAAASLMTESLLGKTVEEAEVLFQNFHAILTQDADSSIEELDKLAVFSGVKQYPARVKCATLPWHTLKAALHGKKTPASTE